MEEASWLVCSWGVQINGERAGMLAYGEVQMSWTTLPEYQRCLWGLTLQRAWRNLVVEMPQTTDALWDLSD